MGGLAYDTRPSKSILAMLKFFKKNQTSSIPIKPTYIQALSNNINDIIKIKESFPKLSTNKVSKIHKVINKTEQKRKYKLNMITKGPSRKQIIIPMSSNNVKRSQIGSICWLYLLRQQRFTLNNE